MAHQLKYILQYYALGTSSYPYYQYKIFQDSAKWNVLDGLMFLQADGAEPTTHELFESSGPIKPSSVLLNLINKRYGANIDSRVVFSKAIAVYGGMAGDGSGTVWIVRGQSIAIKQPLSDTETISTTGSSNSFKDIASAGTNILIAVGNSGEIRRTTTGGSPWSSIASWNSKTLTSIEAAKDDPSVMVALGGDSGVAVLGRSTNSGAAFTNIDSKVSALSCGSSAIDSATLPVKATLFFICTGSLTLYTITTFDTAPSSASLVSGVTNVRHVDFTDANNGYAVGSKAWKTTDGGSNWTEVTLPNGGITDMKYSNGVIVILHNTLDDGDFSYSEDHGTTWNLVLSDMTNDVNHSGVAIYYEGQGITPQIFVSGADAIATTSQVTTYFLSNYLTEFKEIDFAEYYVTLQRSTTDYETGGGSQALILNQAIVDSEYGYTEDWSEPINTTISIRVTDGFNIWNSLEYRTSGGALETGRKKITAILADAFELIYSGFGTTDYFETYATYLNDVLGSDFSTSPSDATNPFVNGFIDSEHFLHEPTKPYTWWEVLTAIFTDYDCNLISNLLSIAGGSPQIIANDRFYNTSTSDNLVRLRYETNGTFDGPPPSVYVRALNSATTVFQGIFQVREKPYQYVEASIKNARPASIVPDYNFELENWSSTSVLNNWTATDLIIARSTTTDSDKYSNYSCNITSEAASLGEGTLASIKTRIPSGTESIYLQIKYHCDVSSSSPAVGKDDNPNFYIQVKYGDQYLYDGSTLQPNPTTHSGAANLTDYSSLSWSSSAAYLLVMVSGDSMDSWVTLNLGEIATPDASGDFQILISEPVNADYSINNFYLDEFYIIPVGDNGVFYEDIKLIGENTAISNGKRLDLGGLHFYDYPKMTIKDYSSAVLSEVTLIVNQITPPNDGDYFELDIDGSLSRYTWRTSGPGANEWTTQQDLIDEIYRDSNHYFVWESDAVAGKITLHALDYADKDFGVIVTTGAALTIENQANFTAPGTSTWTNRATITDDATPTATADWTWHSVTRESTNSEDVEMWKLRLERELARRGLSSQFLQGTVKILSEATDVFGGIMGLLPSGESNYRPISTRGNPFKGEWEVTHEKVHDESVTFVGEEVYEQ